MEDAKRFDGELEKLLKEKEDATGKGDERALANVFYQMGDLHSEFDKLEEALKHYETSLDLYKKAGENVDCCANLLQISGVLSDMGRVDEGIEKGEEAQKLLEKLGNEPLQETAFCQLGKLHKIKGNFDDALQYLNKGRQLSEKLNNRSRISIYDLEIGSVHLETGKLDSAIKSLEQSGKICNEIGDELAFAQVTIKLGQAMAKKGQFTEAEDRLVEACKIFQRLNKLEDLFESAKQLVLVTLERGKSDDAQEYSKEAFATAVASGDLVLQAEGLELMKKVSVPIKHIAAYYSVFLVRSFGKNDELFKKYLIDVLDRLKKHFAEFQFTEITEFSEIILLNFAKSKMLKYQPVSLNDMEKVFELTRCIGRSRGDKLTQHWREAKELSEEIDSLKGLDLGVNKVLDGFVL